MGKISRFIVALDSGAIVALSRGDSKTNARIRKWALEDAHFIVPAPVLTETLRGGAKDAPVHHFINVSGCELAEFSPGAARKAGELLGTSGADPSQTVDAMIVASALEHGARDIFTGDP